MSVTLEVSNWGEWATERTFSSLILARMYGLANFPQNDWRVLNDRGDVVYTYDSTSGLQQTAEQEMDRFRRSEVWRQNQERLERNRELERQRLRDLENMRRVAEEQRETNRRQEHVRQRRARLEGFNFVGGRPTILEGDSPIFPLDFEREERDFYRKADWRKEGF